MTAGVNPPKRRASESLSLSGYFFGVGVGLCDGLGDGLEVIALLATGLLDVLTIGVVTGLGPTLAKYSATGTTMMPMITVRTKVSAPHSRLMKAPFTSR